MLIIFLLIVFASSQQCPYCVYDACQITSQGLGNCSACNVGALVSVETGTVGVSYGQQTIGICQLCPTGCLSCSYELINSAFAQPQPGMNCLDCASSYEYNFTNGACAACSSNCQSCECQGNSCYATYCVTCQSGYNLNGSNYCLPATTATLQSNESQNSSSGLTIGLAIWGAVMTIFTIVFLILWQKRKNQTLDQGLLNSEIEVCKIKS